MIKLMEVLGIFSTFFFGYALCKAVRQILSECLNPSLEMEVEEYVIKRDWLKEEIEVMDERIRKLHERKASLTKEKEELRVEMNKRILDEILEVSIVKNKLETKLSKLLNEDIKIEDEDVRSAIEEKMMKALEKYSDDEVGELSALLKSGIVMKLIENPDYSENNEECSLVDAEEHKPPKVIHV